MSKFINLEGKVFGKIYVLKREENRTTENGNSFTMWLCRCSCGRSDDFIVYGNHLRKGKSTSCSICHHEKIGNSLFIDLTGKVFGWLRVVEFFKREKKKVLLEVYLRY